MTSSPPTPPFLPYGRQCLDADDEAAVLETLRSGWLTQGPAVDRFEQTLRRATGAAHAVACANGTAALQLCWAALGRWDQGESRLRGDDAVIVPSLTFLATATTVHHAGGQAVFADVDPDTGLMTAQTAADALARARAAGLRPLALAPVHFAGQPADMAALGALAAAEGCVVVEDACHALGAADADGREIGGCAHAVMAAFSFHPVKTVAAGEGGAATTNDPELARRLALLRNHGMERSPDRFIDHDDGFDGDAPNPWRYELQQPGHNFRLSDMHAALAASQMKKLPNFVARRAALRARYAEVLAPLAPLARLQPTSAPTPTAERREWKLRPAWHLAIALIDFAAAGISRRRVMEGLKERGVGSQVHYAPVHRQPFWRDRSPTPELPGVEAFYRQALSLPLFPAMQDDDPDRVAAALAAVLGASA